MLFLSTSGNASTMPSYFYNLIAEEAMKTMAWKAWKA